MLIKPNTIYKTLDGQKLYIGCRECDYGIGLIADNHKLKLDMPDYWYYKATGVFGGTGNNKYQLNIATYRYKYAS